MAVSFYLILTVCVSVCVCLCVCVCVCVCVCGTWGPDFPAYPGLGFLVTKFLCFAVSGSAMLPGATRLDGRGGTAGCFLPSLIVLYCRKAPNGAGHVSCLACHLTRSGRPVCVCLLGPVLVCCCLQSCLCVCACVCAWVWWALQWSSLSGGPGVPRAHSSLRPQPPSPPSELPPAPLHWRPAEALLPHTVLTNPPPGSPQPSAGLAPGVAEYDRAPPNHPDMPVIVRDGTIHPQSAHGREGGGCREEGWAGSDGNGQDVQMLHQQ